MTSGEIEALIAERGGGEVESTYGPFLLNSLQVWEVWVFSEEEYQIRFVVESEDKPEYFDSFGSLASRIHSEWLRQLPNKAGLERKRVATYMAAMGFVVGLGLLVYIVLNGRILGAEVLALLVSLLGSGGAYYYGVWKDTPGSETPN